MAAVTHDKINWIHHAAHPDTPNLERSSGCVLQIAPSKNAVPYHPWQTPDAESGRLQIYSPPTACLQYLVLV